MEKYNQGSWKSKWSRFVCHDFRKIYLPSWNKYSVYEREWTKPSQDVWQCCILRFVNHETNKFSFVLRYIFFFCLTKDCFCAKICHTNMLTKLSNCQTARSIRWLWLNCQMCLVVFKLLSFLSHSKKCSSSDFSICMVWGSGKFLHQYQIFCEVTGSWGFVLNSCHV